MSKAIHLDFETYSDIDLRKVGTWVYSKHPSTKLICMAWAVDDEDPVLYQPGWPFPSRLKKLLNEGATLKAWNSFFEWCIWHHTLQWGELPLEQWEDTMAKAAVHNLPLSLEVCGYALGLKEGQRKDKRGMYLINKLCMPHKGFRLYDDVLLREMYEYCKQDVVAERTISKRLTAMPVEERKLWMLDQKINIRGIQVDSTNVQRAIKLLAAIGEDLKEETFLKTGWTLTSTNSRDKVMDYCQDHGYILSGYTKADVVRALRDPNLPEAVRMVLEIRQREGKSSTAKYKKLNDYTSTDGRAHGLLQFHAASTGRWGGRGFQPHNLPRPNPAFKDSAKAIIHSFRFDDHKLFEMFFGEPMECMVTAIRGMLIAAPGKLLYVGDYAQIEARILAWLAQQSDVLEAFRQGLDVYRVTAARIFRCHYDEVTDEQRFIGKIAVLALGYQGGHRAFIKFAEQFGVDDMTAEFATEIKDDWREARSNIVQLWYALEAAALYALEHPGEWSDVRIGRPGSLRFIMGNKFLKLELPSGRHMRYFRPMITGGNIRYMGVDSITHQWTELEMYGGRWAQNICEGIARDLLGYAMHNLENNDFNMVLSVHDENIAEREPGHLDQFTQLMLRKPGWADGLPVAVECFAEQAYRK